MGDEAGILAASGQKKKKDDKYRRRDPKSYENIHKASTAMKEEERDKYFATMYSELYNENRNLFLTLQAREKLVTGLQKDSDRDRSELTKSILARGQLESLCRELQKQNKLIKEENVARIKEEEDRRREVANTFTERLNALTNLITESKDKSNKVKEENQNMTEKLTELYEQYQQRENHLETVTRQLDLQKKLAETQAKKTEIENEAERQTYTAEKKALLMQLEQYEREMVLLQEKNRSLEAQVDLYKSQYSDFETTMTKSNKVFDTFKEEMSRMNKQLHTLEKERNDLRKRWQSSVNSLIVLSEQHVTLSNEQSALEKRLAMLQKLCRQLQEDRSAFLKQLKENNIEPVVPTVKSNETSENDASPQSLDEKALETSKSTQRALKLKQELGKVKEVAALIKMGRDPPGDEDSASNLTGILAQDFETIHGQIEASDAIVDTCLEGSSKSKKLKGNHAAGTSKESQKRKVQATQTVKKAVKTCDFAVQAGPTTTDSSTQPEQVDGGLGLDSFNRENNQLNLVVLCTESVVHPNSESDFSSSSTVEYIGGNGETITISDDSNDIVSPNSSYVEETASTSSSSRLSAPPDDDE